MLFILTMYHELRSNCSVKQNYAWNWQPVALLCKQTRPITSNLFCVTASSIAISCIICSSLLCCMFHTNPGVGYCKYELICVDLILRLCAAQTINAKLYNNGNGKWNSIFLLFIKIILKYYYYITTETFRQKRLTCRSVSDCSRLLKCLYPKQSETFPAKWDRGIILPTG